MLIFYLRWQKDINNSNNGNILANALENQELLFSTPTYSEEIIDIKNQCKSKQSRDHNDTDMILIKDIIHEIVVPINQIFNLSLEMGNFEAQMQIAKAYIQKWG